MVGLRVIRRLKNRFVGSLRRLMATGCAALVFALGVFAASPVLHQQLHHGVDAGHDDGCAVVLFASGVSVPLGAIAIAPPSAHGSDSARETAEQIFLASPRYLRQPERGPPVLG